MENISFLELLNAATVAVLTERRRHIFCLRYGLSNGKTHTYVEIAEEYGLTSERIRQLVNKCQNTIVSKSRSQIRKNEFEKPCARLKQYVENSIRPDEEGHVYRLMKFVEDQFSFLVPSRSLILFVARLIYPNKQIAAQWAYLAFRMLKLQNQKKKLDDI